MLIVKRTMDNFIHELRDDEFFDRHPETIDHYALTSFELFTVFGIIISVLNIVLQIFIGKLPSFYQSLLMMVYCLVMFATFNIYAKRNPKQSRRTFFMFVSPILFFSVLMGTVLDPVAPAFSFPIQIICLPLFLFDKPKKILKYIVAFLLLFTCMTLYAKSADVVKIDMIHFAIFGPSAIIASMFTLYIRILSIKNELKASYLADRDALTGCYNRRGGQKEISRNCEDIESGAFAIIDIDNFKEFNDLYGHLTGDTVLIKVVEALNQYCDKDDYIIRIGGDEFALYFPGLNDKKELTMKLIGIRKAVQELDIRGCSKPITMSVGAVIHNHKVASYEEVFEAADHVLYQIKGNEKNNYRIQIID